jgi:chromosome segregation ATPase
MDEFKDLEEEISKLEGGLGEEDFLSRLRTPAQGDYWKKRMEDEKELWNKTVESKEQENKRLEKKLQNTEEELRILQKKLSEIELSLQKDALEWEDRVRNKDMELVLERERATWSARVKEIEKENEGLKAKVEELKTFADEASKNAELRVSETKSAHKAEMEQLLREQEEVLSTLEAM